MRSNNWQFLDTIFKETNKIMIVSIHASAFKNTFLECQSDSVHLDKTNRTQAVRFSSSLSPWRHTHGGVPQGTKLGITLFDTMINKLLGDWHSRLKYVDYMTVFEVIPHNLTSLLDFAVRDIHNYCIEHSMRLNPKKM